MSQILQVKVQIISLFELHLEILSINNAKGIEDKEQLWCNLYLKQAQLCAKNLDTDTIFLQHPGTKCLREHGHKPFPGPQNTYRLD